MTVLYEYLRQLFIESSIHPRLSIYLAALGTFLAIVIVSLILFFPFRKLFLKIIARFTAHTENEWDDLLLEHKVFHALAHLIPAIFIYSAADFGSGDLVWLPEVIRGIAKIYLMIVVVLGLVRFLDVAQDIYNRQPFSQERPIIGYIQLVKILIYFVSAIIIIGILIGKNPGTLFAGLGAMAAVLILVFRDPILGFVASIQLAANKMVKPGDWITVSKFGVDGIVGEISLTTVKIENWDKTITTLPTYSLVSEPVTNWIGMQESGGRRIQRSVYIDMARVKFCDQKFLEHIAQMSVIKDFVRMKKTMDPSYPGWVESFNSQPTNLTAFRDYVEALLSINPRTHNDMTLIIRYLQPTERGLPLEYIVFSREQQTVEFESIQAEIIEHILAVIGEFDLRVFQNPTGSDFRHIAKNQIQ